MHAVVHDMLTMLSEKNVILKAANMVLKRKERTEGTPKYVIISV